MVFIFFMARRNGVVFICLMARKLFLVFKTFVACMRSVDFIFDVAVFPSHVSSHKTGEQQNAYDQDAQNNTATTQATL